MSFISIDVLDQFQPSKPAPVAPPNTAAIPKTTTDVPKAAVDASEDFAADFERELAESMAAMMAAVNNGPEVSGDKLSEEDKERERAFKAAWEAMLVDGMDGVSDGQIPGLAEYLGKEQAKPGSSSTSYQDAIRQAQQKLKESDTKLNEDSTDGNADELLARLLGELGEDGEGKGLQSYLDSMMGQLMSKEILYEPLKELHEKVAISLSIIIDIKFPQYLKDNDAKLSSEDKTRYKAQIDYIGQIITVFEDPKYNDDDADTRAKIVGLMTSVGSLE